jgi:hypothetical protein
MHVIELGLEGAGLILLAVLVWAVFVYCSPYRPCRWCADRRRPGRAAGAARARCWRCKGTRMTRRLGSRVVHKMKLAVQQAWEERP